ncbi:MAG: single-stranded DNA-binding protein [Eggerthellaceae bacterium]|nr:single-stranded DNA-binding protein [Eggerthellaceae bacterium]
MAINSVSISGNLTRDPEVRQTRSGMPVMTFGVAVNERRKGQSGEWEDYTNFIDCTLFGKRAQSLSQYLGKGTKVSVQGKLHWSQWEDRNGGKRSKVEVVVDEIEFMSQRKQQQSGYQGDAQYVQAETYDAPQGGYYSDEIPFD